MHTITAYSFSTNFSSNQTVKCRKSKLSNQPNMKSRWSLIIAPLAAETKPKNSKKKHNEAVVFTSKSFICRSFLSLTFSLYLSTNFRNQRRPISQNSILSKTQNSKLRERERRRESLKSFQWLTFLVLPTHEWVYIYKKETEARLLQKESCRERKSHGVG